MPLNTDCCLRPWTIAPLLCVCLLTTLLACSDVLAQGCGWRELAVTGPSGRASNGLVYDSWDGLVYLFGGNDDDGTNGGEDRADTWKWDGAQWSPLNISGPSPRYAFGMAFDEHRGVTVLFGGQHDQGFLGDTWEFDGDQWTLVPVDGPTARTNMAMAYDSTRGKVVLFGGGGAGPTYFSDTWSWDGSSWTELQISGPSPRYGCRAVHDASRGETLLFGGWNSGTVFSDTWLLDESGWTQAAASGPDARANPGLSYDSNRGEILLFGGGGYYQHDDMWIWNGDSWTEFLGSRPTARGSTTIAYDAARREHTLFGGHYGNSKLGDTWKYDSSDGRIIEQLLGDEYTQLPPNITLFNQTYYVGGYPVSGRIVKLPFDSWPPSDCDLVTNTQLGELILLKHEFRQQMQQLLPDIVSQELVPIRDHYWLDSWADASPREAMGPTGTTVQLVGKRQVQRYQLAHMLLWSGLEVLKAKLTAGTSLIGTFIGFIEEMDDMGHFDEIDTPEEKAQFRQEVQALLLLQASVDGAFDAFGPIAQLADVDSQEFTTLTTALRNYETLRHLPESEVHVWGIHDAIRTGDNASLHGHIGGLAGALRSVLIPLIVDESAGLVIDALGWEGLDDQVEVAAWLRDMHYAGIAFAANHLIEVANAIDRLESGPDTQAARDELVRTYDTFVTIRSEILWPLLCEHFRVDLAHLHRIQENVGDDVVAYLTGDPNAIAIAADGLDAMVQEYREARARYQDFVEAMIINKAVYVDLRNKVVGLESSGQPNAPLRVTPAVGNYAFLAESSRIDLVCQNDYFQQVTIETVGSGSGRDGISFAGGGAGISIPAQDAASVHIDVDVPLRWFLDGDNAHLENQGFVTLEVPITWIVGGESLTRTFPIPITVKPTAQWVEIAPASGVHRPGESITTGFRYEGGMGDGDLAIAWWLLPNGEQDGLGLGFPEDGFVELTEERLGPPYGAYGARVQLAHVTPDALLIPDTYLNQMWFLVPPVTGDLDAMDRVGTGIVYASEDSASAESLVVALGIESHHAYVVENYSLQELIQFAEAQDTILLGGWRANPLVNELRTQGRVQSEVPDADGEAYVEVVEAAFGSSDAVIVAGYRKVDTDTATVGFLDAWDPDLSGCAADFNEDGVVNTQDVLAFLNAWVANESRADFNGDGSINTQDVLAFLNAWVAGC